LSSTNGTEAERPNTCHHFLALQVSLPFAKGWAALLAVIRDLLSASIVPTAKRLRKLSAKKDELHKAVRQYMLAKGRQVKAMRDSAHALLSCSVSFLHN